MKMNNCLCGHGCKTLTRATCSRTFGGLHGSDLGAFECGRTVIARRPPTKQSQRGMTRLLRRRRLAMTGHQLTSNTRIITCSQPAVNCGQTTGIENYKISTGGLSPVPFWAIDSGDVVPRIAIGACEVGNRWFTSGDNVYATCGYASQVASAKI